MSKNEMSKYNALKVETITYLILSLIFSSIFFSQLILLKFLFIFSSILYYSYNLVKINKFYGKKENSRIEFEERVRLDISNEFNLLKLQKIIMNYCEESKKYIDVDFLEKKYKTTFGKEINFLMNKFENLFIVEKESEEMKLYFLGTSPEFEKFKESIYGSIFKIKNEIENNDKELKLLIEEINDDYYFLNFENKIDRSNENISFIYENKNEEQKEKIILK